MRALLLTLGHGITSSTTTTTTTTITLTPHHHHHHNNGRHHRPSKPSSLSQNPNPNTSHSLESDLPHNTTTLHTASKLAADGRLEEFAVVAAKAVRLGSDESPFVAGLDFELLGKGLYRGLREGKLWSFIEVLRVVGKLGYEPLKLVDGSVMRLLGKECRRLLDCGDVKEFIQVMEVLAGFEFPVKQLVKPSDIIKVCVDQRCPKLAIRYANVLPNAQILFCSVIRDFGKKGDIVSALKAYEASKQTLVGPNAFVYRTIIDICGLCGDYEKSRFIYEDLLNQKADLNIFVFNSLMNVNSHDLNYTLHLYKKMPKHGVKADIASYNILLKACSLAGRVDLAKDIYREVQDLESLGLLKLDLFTYSTVIKIFADCKLWQMALKTKDDMLRAGVTPNTVTWSSLISACANAGLVDQASQLFEEMVRSGCKPNSQCYNILLHACVEAYQYDRAFRLFEAWKERDRHDKLSRKDADEHHNSNGRKDVSTTDHLSFAKKFPFQPTTTSYNILMKACGRDLYHAKALMDEMKMVGLTPDHISWSILIDVCGSSGNAEGAVQILKHMQAAKVNPDVVAYTTAIKVCVASRNLKLAFSLYEEMKGYQVQPNLVTYNTLLRARSRYGSLHEVRQCLGIYQDMRKAGYSANDYFLKQLIEEWCEGVIQGSNQAQEEFSSSIGTGSSKPQSLLLEKVAVHLQKSLAESLLIDLQGLTKVEARIVVLAVLRMIKEKYTMGNAIKDDILIIFGVSEINVNSSDPKSEVRDAITRLLQNELGLEVLWVEPRRGRSNLPRELDSSTRRPAVLQRLKVTRKSLNDWLQRRQKATFH